MLVSTTTLDLCGGTPTSGSGRLTLPSIQFVDFFIPFLYDASVYMSSLFLYDSFRSVNSIYGLSLTVSFIIPLRHYRWLLCECSKRHTLQDNNNIAFDCRRLLYHHCYNFINNTKAVVYIVTEILSELLCNIQFMLCKENQIQTSKWQLNEYYNKTICSIINTYARAAHHHHLYNINKHYAIITFNYAIKHRLAFSYSGVVCLIETSKSNAQILMF